MNTAAQRLAQLPESTRRILLTTAVMMAAIMQVLDTTIANVALPHMQGSMSATQDQIAWVLTSYIIASAIAMPMTGFIAGRFGRKRMIVISVIGFTVTSALCGAAQTLPQMVLFRLLQGVFGASLVPVSQAILLDTFPPAQHAKAMAIWGIAVMVGPILGPTIGGWLTEYYNWRWVFYINVPVGALAALGLFALVRESALDKDRRFDVFGFATFSISIAAFQLMLDRGKSEYWFNSAEIITEAVVAGLFLYLFVVHMFTHKRPFIEPALFRDRNFALCLTFIFIVGVILLSTLALLPPFLQSLLGYSVLDTGLILSPRGAGTMVAMMLSSRVMARFSPRAVITTGLSFTAISLWFMMFFTLDVSRASITWTGFLQGLGLGFIFVPLSSVAFATLDPVYRTEAASVFSLVRSIGSSIGISIVVSELADRLQSNHAILAEHIQPLNHLLDQSLLSRIWDIHSTAGLYALNGEVTRQAAVLAYQQDFQLIFIMVLCIMPLVIFLKPDPTPPAVHETVQE